MSEICIFAGTSEGRKLVERLCGRDMQMTVCVATEYGEVLLGEHPDVKICAGRMDQKQMEEMLRGEDFAAVIDSTHPYADKVTENIAAACQNAGVEYLRLLRASNSDDSDGVFVENTASCVEYLKTTDGNILLTTGSKELPAYKELSDRIYARVLPMQASLDICAQSGIAPERIIAMQGPFNEEMNLALLKMTGAKYMVTKDTGSPGGYAAKISAAKKAGVQAIIIGRPLQREGMDLDAVVRLLEQRFHLRPVKKKVSLVGIGMGNMETRTLGMEKAIHEADCLIGAKRMLDSVDAGNKNVHAAVASKDIVQYIRGSSDQAFAVLFSGDTGFYSGAKALIAELSDCEVEILPGIGSLQYFCSRLQRPWQDVHPVSLHGRDCDFIGEVRRSAAVFALVGGEDGVHSALQRLAGAAMDHLTVHVGQRLGYPGETICHGTVSELLAQTFDSLSVLLVENPDWKNHIVTHGLPDEAFDRDETPMTKSEVRSISLSKLALTQGAVVYDIGSGSGSVSVECALQANRGKVYAVEMKDKAIALTRRNTEKFHLNNLEVIAGIAPDALDNLPTPTHAFIGGSTGNMRGIIDCLLKKNPSVRIVVNTVTLETLAELTAISKEFDFCDITEVSISKPRKLGSYNLMTAQNPVFIFTLQNGTKA